MVKENLHKIKNFIHRKRKISIPMNFDLSFFYLLFFITLFIQYFYFASAIDAGTISFIFRFCSALAESSFWMVLICLIKPKWNVILLIVPFIISWLLIANILFYRNFNDLIPASSYFNSHITDNSILSGALQTLSMPDIIILLVPFVPLLYFIYNRKKYNRCTPLRIYSLFFLGIFALSYGCVWIGAYRRIGIYSNTSDTKEILSNLYPENTTNWKFFYNQHTFHGYILRCLLSKSGEMKKLTDNDLDFIKKHLKKNEGSLRINENKFNLIMIVVESLPSVVLKISYLPEIAPTLWEIANDSTNIVAHAKVLTGLGRSSDAQFIYNTGLLPLRNEPVVTNYALKSYPSLAKAIKFNAVEVIGENKYLWSHGATSISYGFQKLIDSCALNEFNQDSLIFQAAYKEIHDMNQPFFLFVTTLSMHDPYLEHKVSPELHIENIDFRDLEYFNRLNHFDHSLHLFLEKLKTDHLYDTSIIIIAGDHDISELHVSNMLHDDSVPFIIINNPLKDTQWRQDITQIDLFPTILDIYNSDYSFLDINYRGLGRSIFSIDNINSYPPSEEDYKVSEMIIKSYKNLQ